MNAFDFWVEDDRICVRFVSQRVLGRTRSGHPIGGDYNSLVIRLFRGEYRRAARAELLHELGHYLYARQELGRDSSEEEVCDLLTWFPAILDDPRNDALRKFLGLS